MLIAMESCLQIKSFEPIEHDGYKDEALLRKCKMLTCGRWSAESLYSVFVKGKESGTLEHTLNHLGLRESDLEPNERDAAERIYLVARAIGLSVIQEQLTKNSGSAKEAQVLLSEIYNIQPFEKQALTDGSASPVGISFEVKEPVGEIKVTRGE